ncbi:hypothetical protein GCM10022232_75050 [Streptomyces plumbiresistens]|uniref:Uncharacterized protein n=1 Tax=Streptomyces plumbiresistens TaxID=511811 RepID=A0ABP7T210_9ACTN
MPAAAIPRRKDLRVHDCDGRDGCDDSDGCDGLCGSLCGTRRFLSAPGRLGGPSCGPSERGWRMGLGVKAEE